MAEGQRRLWIWLRRHLFSGNGLMTRGRWCRWGLIQCFFKVYYASLMVQASLLSTVKARNKFTLLISRAQPTIQERRRARLCLREGTRFLLSMNQIFCAPAKLSARHSSLCFGQCELIRPASSDVVLLPWTPCVTVCATVPSAQQKPSRHYSHNSQVTN